MCQEICAIVGCESPVYAREWCSLHYNRWRTNGDPLKTRRTPRSEAINYFRGVVLNYEGDDCLIWPYGKTGLGYAQVAVDRKKKLVCRLICELLYGPPPTEKHQAAHSCGNGLKGCCNPKHLRWATASENMQDQIAHGTTAKGERNGNAKLTEAKVAQIRELAGKMAQRKIVEAVGTSQCNVWRVIHGQTWAGNAFS